MGPFKISFIHGLYYKLMSIVTQICLSPFSVEQPLVECWTVLKACVVHCTNICFKRLNDTYQPLYLYCLIHKTFAIDSSGSLMLLDSKQVILNRKSYSFILLSRG